MSIALITAAWRLDGLAPTEKLVLLALCDWANDEGESLHPSIKAIAAKSSLSDRQAQRVVHGLIATGWLEVIGNAVGGAPGATRQYRLNVRKLGATGDAHVRGDKLSRVTPATETGDIGGGRRVTSTTETGDTHVTQTVIEPSIEPSGTVNKENARARAASIPKPEGVTELVWTDFLAIRRAKKSPLTATALAGIEREALKAGMTLAEVLAMCCERGWQGFNAEWVADARKAAQALPWFVRAGYGDEASARAAGASPPGKSISAAAEAGLALAGMTRNRAEVIDV
jgi:hypothetical protein